MGWRGTLRAIAAAQRAAERESIRRQKYLALVEKEQAKLDARARAAYEVDAYENVVERIISVHRDCGPQWNWHLLANKAGPSEPSKVDHAEARARRTLETYQPGIFARLFRQVEKTNARLRQAVENAKEADGLTYMNDMQKFQDARSEWAQTKQLAEQILAGDIEAYTDAVEELTPIHELHELGSKVKVDFRSATSAEVAFQVNGDNVVPAEVKTLLQSGKLSVKKMPQTRFYELYQDYVCGAVLRIARELFGLLPLENVLVTAWSNMLESASGQMEDQPILSVLIPRATLQTLNFERLDPSDSLKYFTHRIDFRKTTGFRRVEPLLMKPTASHG